MTQPLTLVALIAGILVLPGQAARLFQRPRVRAVLLAHGGWLLAAAWIVGLSMIVVPLSADLRHASAHVRGAAFVVCTLGPMLIALVSFGVRDARRETTPRAPSAPAVSGGLRVVCGSLSLLSLGLLCALVWDREWTGAVMVLSCGGLFGYLAITGRAAGFDGPV